MVTLLFLSLTLLSIIQIVWAMRRASGIYEYPFLSSLVYLFFISTQMYVVWRDNIFDEYSVIRVLIMAFACQFAGYIGYTMPSSATIQVAPIFDSRYLKYFAIGSVLFGAFFHYQLLTLPAEMVENSQWSGRSVAFLFLSKPLFLGGVIAFMLSLRFKDRLMTIVAIVVLSFVLYGIAIGGRRGTMVEFVLAVATVLFFVKRWTVPRGLALAAVPLGIIFVNGISIYRSTIKEISRDVSAGSFVKLPVQIATGVGAVLERWDECIIPKRGIELENAVAYMEVISANGNYDFGTGVWDLMVHRLVPAQIVGSGIKESLRFGVIESTAQSSDYKRLLGSTLTGLTDAFQGFGYMGAVYFFICGIIMRRIWNAAESGNFTSQIAYAILLRDSLEAITHNSGYLFVGLVVVWMFLVLPLNFIKRLSNSGTNTMIKQQNFKPNPQNALHVRSGNLRRP